MRYTLLALYFLAFSCQSVEHGKWHYDTYKGQTILVGQISVEQLKDVKIGNWFEENYQNYQPDSEKVSQLKDKLKESRIEIYLGTWCPDSRREVPHFIKILDQAEFDKNNLKIVALPRNFKELSQIKSKKIIRVPTFIIYRKGKETGRIIEYPMQTLEDDLLNIFSGSYRHELNN